MKKDTEAVKEWRRDSVTRELRTVYEKAAVRELNRLLKACTESTDANVLRAMANYTVCSELASALGGKLYLSKDEIDKRKMPEEGTDE